MVTFIGLATGHFISGSQLVIIADGAHQIFQV